MSMQTDDTPQEQRTMTAIEALQARYIVRQPEPEPADAPEAASEESPAELATPAFAEAPAIAAPAPTEPALAVRPARAADPAPADGPEPQGEPADAGSCAQQPSDVAAELRAAEEAAQEQVTAVLTAALDRLGAAHHRPFSRS
jgi:hypothetical protein